MKIAIIGIEWDMVDLIESIPQYEICGFIDPICPQDIDVSYLGRDEDWKTIQQKHPQIKVALALDFPHIKAKLFDHYGEEAIISVISPHAYVSNRSVIGHGTIIQRGVTIMAKVKIGHGCKINVNTTIHHEAKLGNFCTVAPGAFILGKVEIEDGAYIGAGAIIRQRCKIGKGAVIGAGAVVVCDVPPGITVVGVPAKALVKEPVAKRTDLVPNRSFATGSKVSSSQYDPS